MSVPNDTSPEAGRVQVEIFRKMTPDQKWRLLGKLYREQSCFMRPAFVS